MSLTIDIDKKELVLINEDFCHLSKDIAKFKRFTGFDDSDIKKIYYEPDNNFYYVEYFSKEAINNKNDSVIQWIETHFNTIYRFFQIDYEVTVNNFKITLKDEIRGRLLDSDSFVVRHLEEKYFNVDTTLTEEQFLETAIYRRKLRELYNSGVDLDSNAWESDLLPTFPWEYDNVFK